MTARYPSRLPLGPRTVPGRICDFDTANGAPYDYRVWVAWVGRDAAQADRMLDPAGTGARRVAGLGDEVYGFAMLGEQQGLVLRVGRYVAAVREEGGADPRRVADVVVRNLRRLR